MRGKQVFEISGRLSSLNEYTSANRRNKYSGAKIKKLETDRAYYSAKSHKLKPVEAAYFVFIWHRSDKRSDPDNVSSACKFVFDGLVQAEVLANDGPKQVLSICHEFAYDSTDKVVVEIYPQA